jgi:hypothetical protein
METLQPMAPIIPESTVQLRPGGIGCPVPVDGGDAARGARDQREDIGLFRRRL